MNCINSRYIGVNTVNNGVGYRTAAVAIARILCNRALSIHDLVRLTESLGYRLCRRKRLMRTSRDRSLLDGFLSFRKLRQEIIVFVCHMTRSDHFLFFFNKDSVTSRAPAPV